MRFPAFRLAVPALLALALAACTHCPFGFGQHAADSSPRGTDRANFPAEWFAPVPEASAKSWEVLPQAAGPGEVILSKRNELGLLSNFAPTPFEFHGQRYASLEGFWQMMHYPESDTDERAIWAKEHNQPFPHTRAQVAQMTAFEANAAGTAAQKITKQMNIDWVTFEGKKMLYRDPSKGPHYKLIVEATWAKVRQNPKVQEVLLKTGDLKLLPDHHQAPDSPPAWHYFDILMEIRDQLRK